MDMREIVDYSSYKLFLEPGTLAQACKPTLEVEIGRIKVSGQPRQKVQATPSQPLQKAFCYHN
jgi:hypothetical protein